RRAPRDPGIYSRAALGAAAWLPTAYGEALRHPRYLRRGRRPSSSGFGEAFASTGAERTWVLEHRSAAKTEQKPEIGGRPGPLRYRRWALRWRCAEAPAPASVPWHSEGIVVRAEDAELVGGVLRQRSRPRRCGAGRVCARALGREAGCAREVQRLGSAGS